MVTSDLAVFVSPSGVDGAAGTKDAPVKTIQGGLQRLQGTSSKRLYICAGTYPERVDITTAVDGLAIYGGFDSAPHGPTTP